MIEEILNNVTKTKNSSDPFEHKFIKNIFPENFYKSLITNLPHIDDYTPINQTGSVDKNYSPLLDRLKSSAHSYMTSKHRELLPGLLPCYHLRFPAAYHYKLSLVYEV